MDLREQVCKIDLSKKLDELGVIAKSAFKWHYFHDERYPSWEICRRNTTVNRNEYRAYTVAELAEMLPISLNNCHLSCVKLRPGWEIAYGLNQKIFLDKSLPDALAKMLIHVIENKLIKIPIEEEEATPDGYVDGETFIRTAVVYL